MTAPQGKSKINRSTRQWVVRGFLAIIAAALGWISVSDTLANVVNKGDPAAAYVLAPWDGVIAADLAQAGMSTTPTSDEKSRPAKLAREAIRLNPTAVEGLDVLGLQAQLRGRTERAREIFTQSIALSRRELRPQIWAIEEAVSRGDIPGALRQYDIALRTSRRAPEILFPVLASAIAEPRVRATLVDNMKAGPVWGDKFITYVSKGKIDPVAAVSFFREIDQIGLPIVDDADRTLLVNVLARRGDVEGAWDYYRSFRKADRNHARDPNFRSKAVVPAVFDWSARNSPGMSSSIQRRSNGGVVEFSAAPSVGGVVLQQRQFLERGTYAFKTTVEDLEQPDRSRPYWVLTCRNGQELGRIEIPNSKKTKIEVEGLFFVPTQCATQNLALIIRPSDEIAGVFGRVIQAKLEPVKEGAKTGRRRD